MESKIIQAIELFKKLDKMTSKKTLDDARRFVCVQQFLAETRKQIELCP